MTETNATELPALDAVDSRWWYLIAAYPIVSFLFIPVLIIGGLFFIVPVAIIGPGTQPGSGLVALGAIFGILLGIIIIAMIMLTFALIVTPLIGIVIAIYYLYRRHETVGVP